MQHNNSILVMNGLQFQGLLDKIEGIYHLLNSSNKEQKEPEQLLTTKEAAKKLKVCSKTVINYIETGKLNAIKFSKGESKRGHYKLSKTDIDKFVKKYRLGF